MGTEARAHSAHLTFAFSSLAGAGHPRRRGLVRFWWHRRRPARLLGYLLSCSFFSEGGVGVGGERGRPPAPTPALPATAPAPSQGSKTCAATGNGDRARWPEVRGCSAPSSARGKRAPALCPLSRAPEGGDRRQGTPRSARAHAEESGDVCAACGLRRWEGAACALRRVRTWGAEGTEWARVPGRSPQGREVELLDASWRSACTLGPSCWPCAHTRVCVHGPRRRAVLPLRETICWWPTLCHLCHPLPRLPGALGQVNSAGVRDRIGRRRGGSAWTGLRDAGRLWQERGPRVGWLVLSPGTESSRSRLHAL